GRYQGLRGGTIVMLNDQHSNALVVKASVATAQMDAERAPPAPLPGELLPQPSPVIPGGKPVDPQPAPPVSTKPTRFHGSVTLDANRVGRDAGKIAEEIIAHLVGLVGADVTVTLDIEAVIPQGVPDNVVRTVTENCRALKFEAHQHGFEKE